VFKAEPLYVQRGERYNEGYLFKKSRSHKSKVNKIAAKSMIGSAAILKIENVMLRKF